MPPVGFEPTISAGERPQTYALDRAATGNGGSHFKHINKLCKNIQAFSEVNVCSTVYHCDMHNNVALGVYSQVSKSFHTRHKKNIFLLTSTKAINLFRHQHLKNFVIIFSYVYQIMKPPIPLEI